MKPVHISKGNLLYSKSADLNVAHALGLSVLPASFVTLWTVAHQASLSMRFYGQECWSELPLPSPGDIMDPGIEPASLASHALAGRFFTIRQSLQDN